MAEAEGHVLGNFHTYYSFNPVHERLRFMDAQVARALRGSLLRLNEPGDNAAAAIADIGCNEGDLTIGLYDALVGRAKPAPGAGSDDVAHFDDNSVSVLNEKMQKDKKRVEYVFTDEGGSSHRRHFACELLIDGEVMSAGEGVSKKVAKSKAADAALRRLGGAEAQTGADSTAAVASSGDSQSEPEDTALLTARKPLFVLGVDIDDALITRANRKSVDLVEGDEVQFLHADVTSSAFNREMDAFLATSKRVPAAQRKVDLITCFSVTMWIHLNHGDEGLWRFLGTVSDMTEHLLVEPQPWKCYRNAIKRLGRLGAEIPKSFRELKVRNDVVEKIDAFLLDAGRFRFKADLGKTNWSRPVVLYSRRAIPGITYTSAETQ